MKILNFYYLLAYLTYYNLFVQSEYFFRKLFGLLVRHLMLVDTGKVVTRVNHLLPDVAGRHVPPNILLIYERALAGDNKSVSCPIKPKRNRKLLFTSSWSPSMKQINLAQLLFFHKRIFYFPIDIGRKKERMWKNGKESAGTP